MVEENRNQDEELQMKDAFLGSALSRIVQLEEEVSSLRNDLR